MKILFVCSSLEPGKDGVGDYTRKLACSLNKNGNSTSIIAINDRRLESKEWQGLQYDENSAVEVLRLSESLPWNIRIQKAKQFTNAFQPGWVSLQYVPFGFNVKGLPFNLGKKLKQIAQQQHWQIMFHELSVNKDESLKFKLWSYLQVRIIKNLINHIKPAIINTNTELYKYRLKEIGYSATVLPLFSNISRVEKKAESSLENIIPAFIKKYREDYIIGTLFGSFDSRRWDMRSLLNKLGKYGFNKKRVLIISVGKMSGGQECWEELKKDFPQVVFISLGEQSVEFISYWLSNYTHFGILTTLPELAGKSGSFMAFKEHGLPVFCKEKTGSLAALDLPIEEGLIEVNDAKKFQLPSKQKPVSQLQLVTNMFIDKIQSSQLSTVNRQPST